MAVALAPYCGHLRTVANAETTRREQGSTPRPPELNENPSLRIREKTQYKAHPKEPAIQKTVIRYHFFIV